MGFFERDSASRLRARGWMRQECGFFAQTDYYWGKPQCKSLMGHDPISFEYESEILPLNYRDKFRFFNF